MIKSQDFNPGFIKIDKKSQKNITIYYVGYITMKDFNYVKINSVNYFSLVIGKADGHIEENSGNKYLILVSIDKNKENLQNRQNYGIALKIWFKK